MDPGTRTYRTELMNVATLRLAGLWPETATSGGLCVDGHLVAGTDEPMTRIRE
jgi:hypothetical protein